MKLFIQNIPSLRFRILVLEELKAIGLIHTSAELEEADLEGISPAVKYAILTAALRKYGRVAKSEKRAMLLDGVKIAVNEMIQGSDGSPRIKFSIVLSTKLHYNYAYLSALFSHAHGFTLEQFIILSRIERVKELLIKNDHTLTEIAWQLNYSSVAHLSSQFKTITGNTPSYFKRTERERQDLEVLAELELVLPSVMNS